MGSRRIREGVWGMLVVAGIAVCVYAAKPASPPATAPATVPAIASAVGERVPSEDAQIKDLHSLGLLNNRTTVFRSASPVRDLVKGNAIPPDTTLLQQAAKVRMQHLSALGIQTIFSFEDPDTTHPDPESPADVEQRALWIRLEKSAAKDAGITFVSRPIANTGKDSLETLSDNRVQKMADAISVEILKASEKGGVLFHCAAGHDRTGLIAAYIRMKYQRWPVDEAISEMRRLGHNWVKYSKNEGVTSWHEDHLRAIAATLGA